MNKILDYKVKDDTEYKWWDYDTDFTTDTNSVNEELMKNIVIIY